VTVLATPLTSCIQPPIQRAQVNDATAQVKQRDSTSTRRSLEKRQPMIAEMISETCRSLIFHALIVIVFLAMVFAPCFIASDIDLDEDNSKPPSERSR